MSQIINDDFGGAIIVWADRRAGGIGFDVYAQKIDSDGIIQWTPNGFTISAANDHQVSPQIVNVGLGTSIIAWEDYRDGNYDIYGQRIMDNHLGSEPKSITR